jgi:hypothetical protein
MEKKEILRIAVRAIEKGWGYETLYYGDDLYGKEEYADDIWELVVECQNIGTIAFNKKYKTQI